MEKEILKYLGFKSCDLGFFFNWLKESGITLKEVFDYDCYDDRVTINCLIYNMFLVAKDKIEQQINKYYKNKFDLLYDIYINYLDSHLFIGDVEITYEMVKNLTKEEAKEILLASGLYEDELKEVE